MCTDKLNILNTTIFHKKQEFYFNLNCSCSASYCTSETITIQAVKETEYSGTERTRGKEGGLDSISHLH